MLPCSGQLRTRSLQLWPASRSRCSWERRSALGNVSIHGDVMAQLTAACSICLKKPLSCSACIRVLLGDRSGNVDVRLCSQSARIVALRGLWTPREQPAAPPPPGAPPSCAQAAPATARPVRRPPWRRTRARPAPLRTHTTLFACASMSADPLPSSQAVPLRRHGCLEKHRRG